ncbi:MAG: conjugal transfer protein TraH [Pseudomonadota bacterium]
MKWSRMLASLSALVSISLPGEAQVGQDMAEFWQDLNGYGNVSGPSSHDLQSGGYYTLGQIYLRSPRKTLDPIDIQFPSYRAGCGGIDLFAGGFSFIDADEFIDFLKAVAADSAGLIFKAGIDAVSPELGGILADLEERANTINSWNMDSCEAAQSLLGEVHDRAQGKSDYLCRIAGLASGTYEDGADARQKCGMDTGKQGVIDGAGAEFSRQNEENVNRVWLALKDARLTTNRDYAEFLMSMVGMKIIYADDAGTTVPPFPPIPMTSDAFNALLDGGPITLYRCDETDNCLRPSRSDITIGTDEAFRPRVEALLTSITDKARTRTALTQEEIDFVNLAPMPVYKMLVVHTQYNNQAGNPLAAYADVIAGILVVEYLERGLDAVESALKAEGRISIYDSEQVQNTISDLRARLRDQRAVAATEVGGWLAVMEQTQTLERIIAGRLSVDMQGALRFADAVQAR